MLHKMDASHRTVSKFLLAAFSLLVTVGCGSPSSNGIVSRPDVVDLPQTQVKWQSIGNCWAYATMGWAESLVLRGTNEKKNFSESYHSYRHWEYQLLHFGWIKEINTGGGWDSSMNLMRNYGLMAEGDFIPEENEKTKSERQSKALEVINQSLKVGLLSTDRSPASIRQELNRAFNVNLDAVLSKRFWAKDVAIGKAPDGKAITLDSQMNSWSEISWDVQSKLRPIGGQALPLVPQSLSQSNLSLLKRVKKAMNDGHPVVMNWFVDFNALDEKGIFSFERLAARGEGRQGYHQTVLEDYVVKGTDPSTGKIFEVGEGEATAEQKRLALEYGQIQYFVVKNSWGGAERLDRTSYERAGEKGYHRLDSKYLYAWMGFNDEKTAKYQYTTTGVNGFILPAGY
jgi:hypothetical protein